MHWKRARRILEDLRKVSELSFSVRGRRLTFGVCRGPATGAAHGGGGGGRWKSQHRKIVCHSPNVEKPFNSKVIKSFVPEQRSRKCFLWVSCFKNVYFKYSCMAMLHSDVTWVLFVFPLPWAALSVLKFWLEYNMAPIIPSRFRIWTTQHSNT